MRPRRVERGGERDGEAVKHRETERDGEEEERRGSSERMLDCRVGVGATVNDGLCQLYIGPCESQALIQKRDNGIPIMVFRLLPRNAEWAQREALRLLGFYAREDSMLGERESYRCSKISKRRASLIERDDTRRKENRRFGCADLAKVG